jgi:methylenetetrahydrofolate--tRNA-(uracil-5-)-methyltransferase
VTTALGGILTQLRRNPDDYQPSNITFSHLPPSENPRLKKQARYEALARRALGDLERWLNLRSGKNELPALLAAQGTGA